MNMLQTLLNNPHTADGVNRTIERFSGEPYRFKLDPDVQKSIMMRRPLEYARHNLSGIPEDELTVVMGGDFIHHTYPFWVYRDISRFYNPQEAVIVYLNSLINIPQHQKYETGLKFVTHKSNLNSFNIFENINVFHISDFIRHSFLIYNKYIDTPGTEEYKMLKLAEFVKMPRNRLLILAQRFDLLKDMDLSFKDYADLL